MSACLDHHAQIATFHCQRRGETVQLRCQNCGHLVTSVTEPISRQHELLQQHIRQEWENHVRPQAGDYQI